MACSGGHCTSNCYSNQCVYNRASCSSNRIITLSNVTSGNVIKAADIELLRANTINEIDRWNQNHKYDFQKSSSVPFGSGELIDTSKVNKLILDLNNTNHGTTPTISEGQIIKATDLANSMLSLYNSLRTDCICNSDCGAHAVCTCHGNCGCNYSDINLKVNIQYI